MQYPRMRLAAYFTARPVSEGTGGVLQAAAGGYPTVALRADGTVQAWRDNSYGQLGNGTTADSLTPVQVFGLSGIESIDAGGLHSLAVRDDLTLWIWGSNDHGQLGDGTRRSRSVPGQVPPF